jgi:two-component system response regulator FixJ
MNTADIVPSRVFVVEDNPAVSKALELMLKQAGMEALAFENAEQFLDFCLPICPDCSIDPNSGSIECDAAAIIDIRLPGMDGLQLQENLIQNGIQMPIIFLTGYGNIQTCAKAIKCGAVDFLTKPILREPLLAALQSALQKSRQQRLLAIPNKKVCQKLSQLTERQWEVTALAVSGIPNKEIARLLNISYRTVEHHKSNIIRKTGITNLLELAENVKAHKFEADSPTIKVLRAYGFGHIQAMPNHEEQ